MSDLSGPERLSSLFTAADVLCHTPLEDPDAVILDLVRTLAVRLALADPEAVARSVIERERASPTTVAPGLAIPHARAQGVTRLGIAIATSVPGIRFRDPAGTDALVHVVILILSPPDSPGLSLRAVHALSRLLSRPGALADLAALPAPDQVWRYFDHDGSALPPFLCAADIMRREFVSLRDTETLQDAIDRFTEHEASELPVLDKDGDLVGVVTEDELLHVCLPDYILWMDDLSPIINFQPFAQVLRSERRTWLTDIMSSEYAALPQDAPAIQVAKEMARHGLHRVFVLRGKTLVGVITIQDFILKVLRE